MAQPANYTNVSIVYYTGYGCAIAHHLASGRIVTKQYGNFGAAVQATIALVKQNGFTVTSITQQ